VLVEVEYDPSAPTAAELLALQETMHRARQARLDVAGRLAWPEDEVAAELDEIAHDICFERHGWLAPVPNV
jgi:hypothetical protein